MKRTLSSTLERKIKERLQVKYQRRLCKGWGGQGSDRAFSFRSRSEPVDGSYSMIYSAFIFMDKIDGCSENAHRGQI